jgi:malate synthase
MDDKEETAAKIISEHGEKTDTYKAAFEFQEKRNKLVEKYSDGVNLEKVAEENYEDFDEEMDSLETEFFNEIQQCYYYILQKEYEYRTSEEAIKETVIMNEYLFDVNGDIF